MEPASALRRPERMLRLVRALAALSLALGLSAVPLATVTACSCAMSELPDAILAADVAIVGTVEGSVDLGRNDMGERVQTTWRVERSRDAIGTPLRLESWGDSGANCGISFAAGERWLVLAYRGDSALETNSCMQNRRLDGSDPEGEAVIAELVTETPSTDQETTSAVPAPIIAMALAVLLVGAASVIAFRRAESR